MKLALAIKRWVARYDAWCQRMGLTPENRRSCVPVKRESHTQINRTDKHD